ncbi:MAG: hypothetical protein ABI376_06820 [Caulobacteraceae bacterium]
MSVDPIVDEVRAAAAVFGEGAMLVLGALVVGAATAMSTAVGAIPGAVLAGQADRFALDLSRDLRDRLTGSTCLPRNHDAARAMRRAQLQALRYLIEGFKGGDDAFTAVNPGADRLKFAGEATSFVDKRLTLCLTLEVTSEMAEALTSSSNAAFVNDPDDPIGRLARQRQIAEQAVWAEFTAVCPPHPAFEERFFGRLHGKRGWFDAYGAYLAEQIKEYPKFQAIFTASKLVSIEETGIATADSLAVFEERMANDLASMHADLTGWLSDIVATQTEHTLKLDKILAAIFATGGVSKAQAVGASEAEVITLITRLVDRDLNLEQIEAILPQSIDSIRTLYDRLGRLTNDDPEITAKKLAARAAIKSTDYDLADRLLGEAEEADIETGGRRIVRGATSAADRGDLARSQARFEEAANHYDRAAKLVFPFDRQRAWRWRLSHAHTLTEEGRLFPGFAQLRRAIEVLRDDALPLAPRETMPAQWAMTQNNLGVALRTLGERAGGAAGIEALD